MPPLRLPDENRPLHRADKPDVIQKILAHCGLADESARAPPHASPPGFRELQYVSDLEFVHDPGPAEPVKKRAHRPSEPPASVAGEFVGRFMLRAVLSACSCRNAIRVRYDGTVRTEVKPKGSTTVVAVTGCLTSEVSGDVLKRCRSARGRLALDLSELQWADAEGVAAIRELVASGAVVQRASPFIQILTSLAS